jgi:hypothetical protein
MASTGQVSTHTAQSMHASASIAALSSAIVIASLGQSSTQDSQPVHFSVSTLAGICLTLSKKYPATYCERWNLTKLTLDYKGFFCFLQNFETAFFA